MGQVAQDIGHGQANEIVHIEMRFGKDTFERHRFAAVAVVYSARRLIMARGRSRRARHTKAHIRACAHLAQARSFQAGQRFVVGMRFPQRAPDGSVGIVAKTGFPAAPHLHLGTTDGKSVLREFRCTRAALFTID